MVTLVEEVEMFSEDQMEAHSTLAVIVLQLSWQWLGCVYLLEKCEVLSQ